LSATSIIDLIIKDIFGLLLSAAHFSSRNR
jgi:hypothetical protein